MANDGGVADLPFTQDFATSVFLTGGDTVASPDEMVNEFDGARAQSVAFQTALATLDELANSVDQVSAVIELNALLFADLSNGANTTATLLSTSAPDEPLITDNNTPPAYTWNGAGSQQFTAQTTIPTAFIVTNNNQSDHGIKIAHVANMAAATVAAGAAVEIDGVSAQSVSFTGTTGLLTLEDLLSFTGEISGLTGSDALDLVDVSYGANTTATYLGTTEGGTLTVTDGTHTADISLFGNYLSSTWTLSSDGNGGTLVVDPVATNTWQTLDVGAGGWLVGIDIAPDDTMVVRTDTYGAYIWNGNEWQQLVTATSMPTAFVTTIGSQGVYEIQIAPSNSDILYMMYEGHVFKSTNKGTTWIDTSFAPIAENPNDAYRMNGQKMAVDPENSNVVYVGTPENGLFVTANGGTTWQSVSAVPKSLTASGGLYPGITGIEFDPALGVVGGITQTIFAASYGNGVYESTNGGVSWSAIGGPSNVEYAGVSSTGVYYAVGNNNTQLWSYSQGAWTELPVVTGGNLIQTVAIDPFNPNEIIVTTTGGNLNESLNGGTTWSGFNWENHFSAIDVPWLANTGAGMSIGGLVFDQLVPNKLWASAGVGVWDTSVPQNLQWNTPVDWNSRSIGIEQLVANEIIVPPGGDPVLASWDRAFIYMANPDVYPSTYGPVDGKFAAGWSIDYASSNPSFLVGIADWWGTEELGYSTNGGQTWTAFPSFIPGAGTSFIGGTIAASSATDIIWAPADGNVPYYTLNGGESWNAITLPGVSGWSKFDWAYYLDTRTITADRVLPNTFYLYYAGVGVFESTNGGVAWTEVHTGSVSAGDTFNTEIQSVPGEAGNLFFTAGPQSGPQPDKLGFYESINQGVTWTVVPNVLDVNCFGFGAPAPGQSYPSIYIVGWVNNVYGIWQSINDAQSWTQIGTYPTGVLAEIKTIAGNPNVYGEVYVGFAGAGYAYLTAGPVVTGVAASPASGVEILGTTVTLTVNLNEAVTVANGTPTLTLNDGGTATYTGGTGTNALTFSYTVAAGQNTPDLAVTAVNLGTATVTDAAGNAANLAGAVTTFAGLQIDTTTPTVSSVATSGSGINNGIGDLSAGHVVTLTVNLNEAVTVANGTPTLTLNDGGTATYTGGTGTNALTFSYTVAAGQNTPDLAVTAVNLGTATVTDAAGNAANLAGAVTTFAGLQIDTTTPTVTSVTATPVSGDVESGETATVTVTMNEIVNVSGTPILSLNDGGGATYVSGSGTTNLVFRYTVGPGQNSTALQLTGAISGGSIIDAGGNTAVIPPTNLGLQINTDQWKLPVSATWSMTADWSSPAGIPTSSDLVELDAVGTYQVVTGVSYAIAELTTVGTATLDIGGGTLTITNGTGSGAQAGTISVVTGAALEITGIFVNTGTLSLNGSGDLEIAGNSTLSGTGNVTLSDGANNAVISNGAAALLTNLGNTILGAGIIGDSHLTFVNQATINANKTAALVLNTGGNTITNAGTMQATASGGLYIESNVSNAGTIEALGANAKVVMESTITNTLAGLILASGSGGQVDLDNTTISGGTLQTVGSALIETVSGSTDILDSVTISSGSTVEINGGTTLTVDGTDANAGILLANSGTLNIDGAVTGGMTEIGGTGTVAMEVAGGENIAFLASSTGQLALDLATSYTGEISGFGANKSQSIDLTDINFATAQFSYTGSASSGVLTVTDGTNTAHLQLEGSYTLANFDIASDGHGGTLLTDPPVVMQMPGNAPASIAGGTVLEINTPDQGAVTFAGPSGSLWLDQPSTFTGTVASFSGHDVIDLPGIALCTDTALGYLPNQTGAAPSTSTSPESEAGDINTGGTLTVSDGTHTASLAFIGNYTASSFAISSDGHGGTLIADTSPPTVSSDTSTEASGAGGVSGTVTFADSDSSNTQTASFTANGSNYVGTFSVDPASESNGGAAVGFQFSFGNDQINLTSGQTLTQSYDVSVADAQNPAENLNQTVSVSIGGPGNDTFVFHPGIGAETILNFNPQHDTIELDHFANAQTTQELSALIANDAHGDAVIDLGHSDSITIPGMTPAELQHVLATAVHLH